VEQRMVVVLRDIQGWAYEEIAKIMQVPIGTVRSRLARGRETLRLTLADLAPVGTRS
jgi:RNA polymerase sigma-70 factor, ECF subfamily